TAIDCSSGRDAHGRPAAHESGGSRPGPCRAAVYRGWKSRPRRHSRQPLRCLVAAPDRWTADEAATYPGGSFANNLVARMTPELEAAYRACRGVARNAASNFSCIEWFLPLDQRRSMQALYAFAR